MFALSETFKALLKEAQFTQEMLGAGSTQIRLANYATKGIYFQAFTSLSTGLERIGKLCLLLDYQIVQGAFPAASEISAIGHKLILLYQRSQEIAARHSVAFNFLPNLSNPVHQAITKVLHDFAMGDRYSNISLATRDPRAGDPIAAWHNTVDIPLFDSRVSPEKKRKIAEQAAIVSELIGPMSAVLHLSETGDEITDLQQASQMTGVYEAVAPYRQVCVLQVVRYWVELLKALQWIATSKSDDIPHFGEIFALFNNDDSYLRTRKTWLRP
jgi:hypothetical protein